MTKIIKHAREASSTMAHGLLLGLDLDGVLEVSNSFPLPPHPGEDDEKSAKSTGRQCISYTPLIVDTLKYSKDSSFNAPFSKRGPGGR